MLRNCIASRRPATFAWDLVAVSEMAHSMLMRVARTPAGLAERRRERSLARARVIATDVTCVLGTQRVDQKELR